MGTIILKSGKEITIECLTPEHVRQINASDGIWNLCNTKEGSFAIRTEEIAAILYPNLYRFAGSNEG